MCNKIVDLLISNHIISKDDQEIYVFGLYQTFSFVINIMTSLFIFAVFQMYIEGLLFCFFYYLLRCYGGGYHSQSVVVCYILSTFLIVGVLYTVTLIKNNMVFIFIGILCFIIVFIISPVDTRNKRLDLKEKSVYQGKTRMILILGALVIGCMYFIDFKEGVICIGLSFIVEAIMQLIGLIDNQCR